MGAGKPGKISEAENAQVASFIVILLPSFRRPSRQRPDNAGTAFGHALP